MWGHWFISSTPASFVAVSVLERKDNIMGNETGLKRTAWLTWVSGWDLLVLIEGPEAREWALNFIIQNVCIVSFLCKEGTGNLLSLLWWILERKGYFERGWENTCWMCNIKTQMKKANTSWDLPGAPVVKYACQCREHGRVQPLVQELRTLMLSGNWAWALLVPQLRPDTAK